MPGASIQLEVHDDHVALEDPEMITMTITVVEKPCDLVEITPFSQTNILISDDDGKCNLEASTDYTVSTFTLA